MKRSQFRQTLCRLEERIRPTLAADADLDDESLVTIAAALLGRDDDDVQAARRFMHRRSERGELVTDDVVLLLAAGLEVLADPRVVQVDSVEDGFVIRTNDENDWWVGPDGIQAIGSEKAP